MFKVNNKAIGTVLVALLLTFNIFHTFVLVFLSIVNFEHVIADWGNSSLKDTNY